jgi:hypothetical protein
MSDNGSPAPEEKPESLQIKVREQDGQEMEFKIKMRTQMKKVIDAYCKAHSVDPAFRRFTLEGHRIQNNDTPASLDMEDGDVIDVFLEQQGGALRR